MKKKKQKIITTLQKLLLTKHRKKTRILEYVNTPKSAIWTACFQGYREHKLHNVACLSTNQRINNNKDVKIVSEHLYTDIYIILIDMSLNHFFLNYFSF